MDTKTMTLSYRGHQIGVEIDANTARVYFDGKLMRILYNKSDLANCLERIKEKVDELA